MALDSLRVQRRRHSRGRLYYYEPNSSHFARILEERVDKVDAMDKVDWITCGVWRPRAALHVIYCLVAALPRCATQFLAIALDSLRARLLGCGKPFEAVCGAVGGAWLRSAIC